MVLELRQISKKVGQDTHLYPTSLRLEPGKFNILLGATNSGKTSLIKILSGLEKPTTGEVWMDGENVTGVTPQKRNIALVHQFFVNYPHLNVFENIASPLRVAGVAKSEISDRVKEAADILQLGPMLYRQPGELSGGQQQRCALARAIVKESKAIFLDEPLANLDYKLREELRDQLPELFAGRGAIVVYATSEPSEALLLGGNTALVHAGKITQFGETTAVYRNPVDAISAEVFSDPPINVTNVTKTGNWIRLNDAVKWKATGSSADLADGPYTIGIRPHFIKPEKDKKGLVEILGKVEITELSGSESVAHFQVSGNTWVSLDSGVHPYQIGEEHLFYMDPTACFYFDADGKLAATGGTDG